MDELTKSMFTQHRTSQHHKVQNPQAQSINKSNYNSLKLSFLENYRSKNKNILQTALEKRVDEQIMNTQTLNRKSQNIHKKTKFVQSKQFNSTKIRFEEEFKSSQKRSLSDKNISKKKIIESTPNYFGQVIEAKPAILYRKNTFFSQLNKTPNKSNKIFRKASLPSLPRRQSPLGKNNFPQQSPNKIFLFPDVKQDHARFLDSIRNAKKIALDFQQKIFKYH